MSTDILMDLMMFFAYFLIGYCAVKLMMAIAVYFLDRKLEQLHAELKEAQENNLPCRVERHGDIFYMYDARTGDFVAQGATVEELRDHIALTKWRNLRVYVSEGEDAVIETLKGTLTNPGAEHA